MERSVREGIFINKRFPLFQVFFPIILKRWSATEVYFYKIILKKDDQFWLSQNLQT